MHTNVVELKIDAGIATVILKDEANKNTFTAAFIDELTSIFQIIKKNSELKVVLVYGSENIFCAGGTKQELLNFSQGKNDFSSGNFLSLFLDCEIPVIAAMQGHAIGGGLCFGLMADIIIMSERALYAANFMKYGFTPGMGATMILPLKLGYSLAVEMMFTAKNYSGGELRTRGVQIEVLPHDEVIQYSYKIAKELVMAPRLSLTLLKKTFADEIKKQLEIVIQNELAMHELSFRLPVVKENIEKLY